MGLIYRLIRALVRAALSFYFTEIEVRGRENVPGDAPLMMLANHQNGLVDPLLLIAGCDRAVRFIAKAPLFKVPILGFFMRRMGCIPAYRRQDQGYAKEKNDQLFESVSRALTERAAIGIFPEGKSHTDPSLAEFKHGAARMALDAEARAGFQGGLRVQLVGIHFEKRRTFRGKVLIAFAPPTTLEEFREPFAVDPRAAVESLTSALHDRMGRMLLTAENDEALRLAETVDRLGVIEEEETGLKGKLDRKKLIVERYRELRESRPREVEQVRELVRSYQATLDALQIRDTQVVADYRPLKVAAFTLLNLAMIVLGTPLFVLGLLLNGPPYILVRLLVAFTGKDVDTRASVGLLTSLFIFPIWYGVIGWLGWRYFPAWVWIPSVALAPFLGAAAIAWLVRWRRLGRAARGLLVAVRLPGVRKGLREAREMILKRIESLTH